MFHRFIGFLLFSALFLPATITTAINCPDTQPKITGPNEVGASSNSVQYTTPSVSGHSYSWIVKQLPGLTVVNTSTSNILTQVWSTPGDYMIELTEGITGNACTPIAATPLTISVKPMLTAYFYYEFDANKGCFFNVVNFTASGDGNYPPLDASISYIWKYRVYNPVGPWLTTNITTIGPNTCQIDFPTTPGITYEVNLKVTKTISGRLWTDEITDYVYVDPDKYKPVPALAIPTDPPCLYNPYTFSAVGSKPTFFNTSETFLYVDWNFGDGTTQHYEKTGSVVPPLTTTHTYTSPGTKIVTLMLTNTIHCYISKQITIVVPSTIPLAEFRADPACVSFPTYIYDLSTRAVAGGDITKWEYNWGDGSSTVYDLNSIPPTPPPAQIEHLYSTSGLKQATLRVTNASTCISEIFRYNINVTQSPLADFEYNLTCVNNAVTFLDKSTRNGGSAIASRLWDYGDGIWTTNSTYTFTTPGIKTVRLKVTNVDGCENIKTDNTIEIHPSPAFSPNPAVGFTWAAATLPFEIQFTDNTILAEVGNNLQWSYGDGSYGFGKNPVHNYNISGTYNVEMTCTNTYGCTNYYPELITFAPPVPTFQIFPTEACLDKVVRVEPNPIAGTILSEEWWYQDEGYPKDPTLPPTEPYTVRHIFVPPVPMPAADTHFFKNYGAKAILHLVTLAGTASSTTTVDYVNFVNIHDTAIARYTWNNINQVPVGGPPLPGCKGQEVFFFDQSTPPAGSPTSQIVAWTWEFDDPASSGNNIAYTQNCSHVFIDPIRTTFNVKLTVTSSDNSCESFIIKTITIKPSPPVNFLVNGSATTNVGCLSTAALPAVVNFDYDPAIIPIPALIVNWLWEYGDGTFESGPYKRNVSHAYLTSGWKTVKLTITDADGCINTLSKQVYINPSPIADFTFAPNTCEGQAVQFTDQSVPGGGLLNDYIVRWEWLWGDSLAGPRVVTNNGTVFHTFQVIPGQYTWDVKLRVTTNYGCVHEVTKQVSLKASPVAFFEVQPLSPQCMTPQSVQFEDKTVPTASTGPITGWLWDFNDGGSSTLQNPSHVFLNAGTYSVSITVTTANGCFNTYVAHPPITIYQLPVADFHTTSSTTTCEGTPVQFIDDSQPNATSIINYAWTFGDGGSSGLKNPLHTYSTYGIFQVTLVITNSNGCIQTVTKPVMVNPKPIPQFIFTVAVCLSDPVSYTDQSFIPAGFTGYISRWVWDFGDGTTPVTFNYPTSPNTTHTFAGSALTHVVRLTVTTTNGCTDYLEKTVNSIPSPKANFTTSGSLCLGQSVQFNDLSQNNGGGSLQSWNWNFGDPLSGTDNTSTLQNPQHAFTSSGAYNVRLTVASMNGCSKDTTISININILPIANFAIAATSTACEGSPVQFTDLSSPNAPSISSYAWSFGDGGTSVLQNPLHAFNTYGNFNVTLTIVNSLGCMHSVTKTVVINPKPIPDFLFSNANCVGAPVNFTDQSIVPAGSTTYLSTWLWDFGDGSTIPPILFPANPNITHTFVGNASQHVVRLTVTTNTGCISYIEKVITSAPAPIANFTTSSIACDNQPFQFTDLSQTNGGGGIQSWSWNFGDPASGSNNTSPLQNPIHQFTTANTYTITFIVTNVNGCKDTLLPLPTVVVNGRPLSNFVADTVCQGTLTTFTNTSTTPSGTIVSSLWNFGDGGISTTGSPTHLFPNSGVFNVKLTVTNSHGCLKDTTKAVLVLGKPVASFSYSSPNCAGDSVQFTDLSSTPHGSIVQWIWDFNDGNTQTIDFPDNQNVKHKFTIGGNYNVKLTIVTSDGCQTEKINLVQIGMRPLANFSFETNACALRAVQFTDLSQLNGGSSITVWSWNFGDPASGTNNTSATQNPTHEFTTGGPFTVRLMVTNANGCSDSVVGGKVISVNAAPVASFTADTACLLSPTQFNDASTTPAGTITTWAWNFGDPGSGSNNTSAEQNPVHVYNIQGTYNVTLQVTNSSQCLKDTIVQIIVNPKPIAMFQYTAACINDSTQFTDVSTAPGSQIQNWFWDFGDGTGTSTLQNPKYLYSAPGTYNVKLKVTNLTNCSDSVTIQVVARPVPDAQFSYVNYFCPKGKVDFQDKSTASAAAITDRLWIFQPGYTSSIPNPSYIFPVTDTTYVVTLIVTDTYGCMDTIIDSVYVKPGFKFTFRNDTVCQGYINHFQPWNQTPGDSLYSVTWNFGDPASGPANTSPLYSPTHIFTGPGNFIVKMKAFNSDNCVDSVYREIQVYAAPKPNFYYVGPTCDSSLYFTDSTFNTGTGAITSWKWKWGDGGETTILAPGPGNTSHLYVNAGIYPVTLVITNIHGCIDSVTKDVQRFPCIMAEFTYKDTLCARNKIAFTDNSLPVSRINQWHWSWGDGKDTTYLTHTTPVMHTFANGGTYSVTLTVQALVNGSTIVEHKSNSVKIRPTPVALFANEPVCLNQVTFFRDTSLTYGEKNTWWHWSFSGNPKDPTNGDTSNVKNPNHLYDTAGTYKVYLTVHNAYGCLDTLNKSTRVYSLPTASYDNTMACAGDPTLFTDKSAKGDTLLWKWRWFFGDPTSLKDTSQLQNPSYKYPNTGDFSMRMIVKDHFGCIDTIDSTVTVNITPVSAFTLENGYNGKQGQVKLNNLSSGADNYTWEFGDGKSSTDVNPVTAYTEDGTYIIKLISFNNFECSDTTLYQYKLLFKGLFVPNAFSPTNNNLGVRLFIPVGMNLKQYHVTVFDSWGHLMWESYKIDDKGRPVEGWDGTFEGNLMPQGNYIWKISALFVDDTSWSGSDTGQGNYNTMGSVTLIR
ncbi:MAG: PKD domain-containing protein [Bacteroidota bacterium]